MSLYSVVSSNQAGPRRTLGAIPEAPEKWLFAGLIGAWLTSDGGGV
jgi:hypothetical protein